MERYLTCPDCGRKTYLSGEHLYDDIVVCKHCQSYIENTLKPPPTETKTLADRLQEKTEETLPAKEFNRTSLEFDTMVRRSCDLGLEKLLQNENWFRMFDAYDVREKIFHYLKKNGSPDVIKHAAWLCNNYSPYPKDWIKLAGKSYDTLYKDMGLRELLYMNMALVSFDEALVKRDVWLLHKLLFEMPKQMILSSKRYKQAQVVFRSLDKSRAGLDERDKELVRWQDPDTKEEWVLSGAVPKDRLMALSFLKPADRLGKKG